MGKINKKEALEIKNEEFVVYYPMEFNEKVEDFIIRTVKKDTLISEDEKESLEIMGNKFDETP